jgi:transposase
MEKPAKHPGGRPTVYKPEYCQKVIDFMSQGYSLEAFAGSIGHHKQTVYEWRNKHPEFGDAIMRAFESCRLYWEKIGMQGVYSNDENAKFNATAWIFNMKNRFGWRDQMNMEVSGKDGGPIQHAHLHLQALPDQDLLSLVSEHLNTQSLQIGTEVKQLAPREKEDHDSH